MEDAVNIAAQPPLPGAAAHSSLVSGRVSVRVRVRVRVGVRVGVRARVRVRVTWRAPRCRAAPR